LSVKIVLLIERSICSCSTQAMGAIIYISFSLSSTSRATCHTSSSNTSSFESSTSTSNSGAEFCSPETQNILNIIT